MKIPPLSPSLGNHLSNWKVCILLVEAERIEQSDAELSPIFFLPFLPVSHLSCSQTFQLPLPKRTPRPGPDPKQHKV